MQGSYLNKQASQDFLQPYNAIPPTFRNSSQGRKTPFSEVKILHETNLVLLKNANKSLTNRRQRTN